MIYLTFNDQPSGVYSSQVCDVCNYINRQLNGKIRLVAIISLRGYVKNRKIIRSEVPDAFVIPMFPKSRYWKINTLSVMFICLLTGERKIIARNVLAAKMALWLRNKGLVKKVCYDGRGAISSEWNEYEVIDDKKMVASITSWEKEAVNQSDFRIAVSQKLKEWWSEAFGYSSEKHVVIPCTLHTSFRLKLYSTDEIAIIRKQEDFKNEDVILVYSGSNSGWQSFSSLEKLLVQILSAGKNYKLLFLSGADESIERLKEAWPGQVYNKWLPYERVQQVLSMCDYGILYREKSITNRVAAPTKFAEYLSSGLPVIISEEVGDYSGFVSHHKCGLVIGEGLPTSLPKTEIQEKIRMINLVSEHFAKDANRKSYEQVLSAMNN